MAGRFPTICSERTGAANSMLLHSLKSPLRGEIISSYDHLENAMNRVNVRTGGGTGSSRLTAGDDTPTPLHRFLEYSAVILFPLVFTPALLASYYRLSQTGPIWLAALGTLLGLIFGDFITGLVHWAADTYCEENTPVIGRSLVKPFRVHHARPLEICEHGIIETIGNACIPAVPLLSVFLALTVSGGLSSYSAFTVFTGVVTVGVTVATNQFHKWAHQDAPPPPVRVLQGVGIILGPEHHQAHHTAPFKSNYSITNGWLNPLLNRTHFFRMLEHMFRAFGIRPSSET